MIHGNSQDPVIIKKINVKIWHLRDEIKATVEERIKNNPDEKSLSIDDLVEEYKLPPATGPVPGLSIAPDEADTEEQAEGEGENADEDTKASDTPITIKQRIPKLPEDKIILGTAVLGELDIDHLYLFTNKQFLAGQSVVVEFVVPKRFVINADVSFSRAYNMQSRIISDGKLPFRTGLKFTFLKAGERTLLRNFILSVEPVIPAPSVDMKKLAKKEDDFDELDDFDL